MEKEPASRWWINCVKQFKLKTATRTRDQRGFEGQGITPERDDPLIFGYADASGGGKAIRAKCAAVVLCCRPLSLVDC